MTAELYNMELLILEYNISWIIHPFIQVTSTVKFTCLSTAHWTPSTGTVAQHAQTLLIGNLIGTDYRRYIIITLH